MSHALPLPLRRWLLLQSLLVLIGLFALPAWADERSSERDPPTRVARVAELQGEVLWYDSEEREWQPLQRNQTLAEGDRLRVGERARLGLRIGAHGLWLDERSELELRRLDDDSIDLDLERGALALRWLNRDAAQEAQVRTRDGRFSFERAGAYRVDQLQRGSRGQAFEGRLRFDHRGDGGAPLYVETGEQAELWWDGGPRAERSRSMRSDDFGDWLTASLGFGRQDVASLGDRPAYRYVSPELTGADELDSYGRWEQTAEFGPIWYPMRVAVDWAPYRYGRWTWTRHWGWTWIDDLPWGYATSHYGRWVYHRNRWCWTPGAVIVRRPVFAPALVAWVGSGPIQVGVQIGHRHAPPVAWVPLAPSERYRPWYRHGPRYQARFDADPVTVRRPSQGHGGWVGHNRGVPGAISTFERNAAQGNAHTVLRPVPLRDTQEARAMQPMPQAPTRQLVREWTGAPMQAQGGRARADDDEGPRRRAGGSGGLSSSGRAEVGQAPPEAMQTLPMRPQPEQRNPEVPLREEPARGEPRLQRSDEGPQRQQPERIERLRREREQGDERNLPWRQTPAQRIETPRAAEPRMPEAQRIEVQRPQEPRRVEAPRIEAPRAPETMRRIEVPRAEPQRQTEVPRRGRDTDEGPRRNDAR